MLLLGDSRMKRFVEGEDRLQAALLPHCLDDYVTEDNPVRVIEAFIDELDLAILGFESVVPEDWSPGLSARTTRWRTARRDPAEPAARACRSG
jgi:hypothetical protein